MTSNRQAAMAVAREGVWKGKKMEGNKGEIDARWLYTVQRDCDIMMCVYSNLEIEFLIYSRRGAILVYLWLLFTLRFSWIRNIQCHSEVRIGCSVLKRKMGMRGYGSGLSILEWSVPHCDIHSPNCSLCSLLVNGILYTTGVYNTCLCQIDVVSAIGCSLLFSLFLSPLVVVWTPVSIVSLCRSIEGLMRRLDCFENGRTKEEEDEKGHCTQERRNDHRWEGEREREEKTNNLPYILIDVDSHSRVLLYLTHITHPHS